MKQTEEKGKGGRKRTHLVKVYLNDTEYEKLCKDAATFKRDKSNGTLRALSSLLLSARRETQGDPKESRSLGVVIVKDLSRFGRNYLDVRKCFFLAPPAGLEPATT